MMKNILFLIVVLCAGFIKAQETQINGYAPAYVGKSIEIYAIDDYISMHESLIGNAIVKEDSSFSIKVLCKEIQKVNVKAENNKSYMYIQPKATYTLFIPERDYYEPYRVTGSKIELTFLDLDSLDINYKILGFDRYMDDFIANYYYLKGFKPAEFGSKLMVFKKNIEQHYTKDTNVFFLTYLRFKVASLDNIQFSGERNRYEKFDFYLKNPPIFEKNDAYVTYIKGFYDNLEGYMTMETNNKIQTGIKSASPNKIMKALEGEYTLSNVKMRELIMLKHLSKLFYSPDVSKQNVLTILDSVSRYSYFKSNGLVAKNLIEQLTKLVSGSYAPRMEFTDLNGLPFSLEMVKGKYTYFSFLDLNSIKTKEILDPLLGLFKKYQNEINFVTFIKEVELTEIGKENLKKMPWTVVSVVKEDKFWKDYLIETMPYFILIDPQGIIAFAPAYSPLPNSSRRSIEETFFSIKRNIQQQKY